MASLRPPPERAGGQDPMAPVARALGLSGDGLRQRLQHGNSLSDLAEEQGVSHADLIAAIKAGKPVSDANGAAAAENDDAAAERIAAATGKPPDDPDRFQRPGTLLDTTA
ncbi:hypothetical protein ACFFX1_20995 [Dactylosporangium sucinum]|nr:hypothetical protein [Dactylosporangium sucinum]